MLMTDSSTVAQGTQPRGPISPSSRLPSAARWKWLAALGLVLLLLGVAGVSLSLLLDLTSLLVFGPLLVASGIAQGLVGFIAVRGRESLLHLLAGGIEGGLGLWLLNAPPDTAGSLVALIATVLIVGGLIRLGRWVVTRDRGRAWILLTGVLALLLALAVWVGGAAVQWWFVGMCLAVDFLCHGASWSLVALAERKPLPEYSL
jgi:uncharacterized membrane protein HdeD (DUF308 family)